jgi:hypothetical protein
MPGGRRYVAFSAAPPTSGSTLAFISSGSAGAATTLVQVATPSTTGIYLLEWGITCTGNATVAGSPAYLPGRAELFQSSGSASTGTALTPTPYGSDADASLCVGGDPGTEYQPLLEGTVGTTRMLDARFVSASSGFRKQFPPGREPYVAPSKFLRVRTTFGTSGVSSTGAYMVAYVIWEEE